MSELVLQFSTSAPVWRKWSPPSLRQTFPLNIALDKNWASPLIRRMCHSPFSHIDIILDSGMLLGASDNPLAPVIEGNPRGVAIRPPDYQEFGYRRRMCLDTDRARDIQLIALTQLGKDFDNSSLKDFLSDKFPGSRDWRLDSSWFCAELVLWALDVGGLWQPRSLQWPKNRVSPTDLLLLMLMDERWTNRERFWLPVPGLKLGPHES